MSAPRRRLVHYGPDRKFPLRTLCGAGRSGLQIRYWRSVYIAHEAPAVTCPRCARLLRAAETFPVRRSDGRVVEVTVPKNENEK